MSITRSFEGGKMSIDPIYRENDAVDNRNYRAGQIHIAILLAVLMLAVAMIGLVGGAMWPENAYWQFLVIWTIRLWFMFVVPVVVLPIWLYRRVRGAHFSIDVALSGLVALVFTVIYWLVLLAA